MSMPLLLLGWVLGCAAVQVNPGADPLALLTAVDQAWAVRGQQGERPFRDALERATAHFGKDHPAIAWRTARWRLHQGLGEADTTKARGRFAAAREAAMDCLLAESGFAQRLDGQGWEEALTVLERDRQVCALWTGLGWTRWLETFDVTAARADLETVYVLLKVGKPAGPRLHAWGFGLLATLDPRTDGARKARGEQALLQTMDDQPRSWVVKLDVARHVAVPNDDSELLSRCRSGARRANPLLPEERLAAKRLLGL